MDKLKFYKFTTWGLLLLNLMIIAFFFFLKPPPDKAGNFRMMALDMLALDGQQRDAFLKLTDDHSQKMTMLNKQQQSLLLPYFQQIQANLPPSTNDTILTKYQLLERDKITTTYQHFLDVKALLKEEQAGKFEPFLEQATQVILLTSKKGPSPPKGF